MWFLMLLPFLYRSEVTYYERMFTERRYNMALLLITTLINEYSY